MKVDFMIIGAMKCGTSTLASILSKHPEVSFSLPKEPMFFSNTTNWKKELDEYHTIFKKEGRVYGEGSTNYTKSPMFNKNIWDDIYEYNPDVKLIYLVRHPIDRVISHYVHSYQRSFTQLPLEKAVKEYPPLINVCRYHTQIKPYIDRFGKEQVLILDFDDLLANKDELLKKVAEYIGIDFDQFGDYNNIHSNKTIGGKTKGNHKFDKLSKIVSPIGKLMPKGIRRKLWSILTNEKRRTFDKKPTLTKEYQELILNMIDLEISSFETLTGKDFSKWRTLK